MDQFLCVAGTTLTHLGPSGNATPRQLDRALKELIAHYKPISFAIYHLYTPAEVEAVIARL